MHSVNTLNLQFIILQMFGPSTQLTVQVFDVNMSAALVFESLTTARSSFSFVNVMCRELHTMKFWTEIATSLLIPKRIILKYSTIY
jgi:hypothetical protein